MRMKEVTEQDRQTMRDEIRRIAAEYAAEEERRRQSRASQDAIADSLHRICKASKAKQRDIANEAGISRGHLCNTLNRCNGCTRAAADKIVRACVALASKVTSQPRQH